MAGNVPYFEELQGRIRGLLISVSDQLPPVTVQLVGEMIDANECGVALETISEMLVESRAEISPDVFAGVRQLAETMGLEPSDVDRLRPLVVSADDNADQ